jgi:hypothetical protein
MASIVPTTQITNLTNSYFFEGTASANVSSKADSSSSMVSAFFTRGIRAL